MSERVGEAGRRGEELRSDLWVRFEAQESGRIEIVLERSKVAPYYGDAIRAQAEELLDQLGVMQGRLTIVDEGALPYVIAARVEGAVRAAGLGRGRRALPGHPSYGGPSARGRLRRSRLYLPGAEAKFHVNAGLHGPDGVILDLEDSVHPAEKEGARYVVRNALHAIDFRGAERMVRINQGQLGLADLDVVVPANPDLVLIPKVESAEEVQRVAQRIASIQAESGLERPIWLMPILESALGLERAFEIASGHELVVALTIGLEDYTADLGVAKTREGHESLWARRRLVNAAHAAGVQAIDSVYGDVGDFEGLAAWARRSRAMGFTGMGCVHPRQIRVIHEAFAPAQAEIDKALRIVEAFEEAQAKGLGVVSLGTKMIDAPVVNRALKLVQEARAMGLVAEQEGAS